MSLKRKVLQRTKRRADRVHAKIRAVSIRPRLSIARSLKHFYVQIIDDAKGTTLCACSTLEVKVTGDKKARARAIGLELAKRAKERGITQVAFDRGGFLYHGRVQQFADGAREGGLIF
jgi:large subunit ribosomal protein L18